MFMGGAGGSLDKLPSVALTLVLEVDHLARPSPRRLSSWAGSADI